MAEYHQITLSEWVEMKNQLRRELNNVRTSFIRVGYVLRKMEESGAYRAEGYKSIAEFAEKEHGLKPSTTSRWMSINKEYSLDGYSMQLDPKWIDMNASQLTEMLALPAEDRGLISPGTPREDIRELKRLEKMPEEQSGFNELVRSFFESYPEELKELRKLQSNPGKYSEQAWIEMIAPSGNRAYRKNGAMLFLYEDKIKFKRVGHSPEVVQWQEFWAAIEGINISDEEDTEAVDGSTAVKGKEKAQGEAGKSSGRSEGPSGKGVDDGRRVESEREGKDVGADDTGGTEAARGAGEHNAEAGETESNGRRSAAPGDENEETAAGEGYEEPADECQRVPSGESGVDEQERAESGIKEAQKDDAEVIAPAQIVDEEGNPSPEEKSERDERIETARDNAALRYADLGRMIKEKRWFKARELAAALHEDLEYLAGADDEPFRRQIGFYKDVDSGLGGAE